MDMVPVKGSQSLSLATLHKPTLFIFRDTNGWFTIPWQVTLAILMAQDFFPLSLRLLLLASSAFFYGRCSSSIFR